MLTSIHHPFTPTHRRVVGDILVIRPADHSGIPAMLQQSRQPYSAESSHGAPEDQTSRMLTFPSLVRGVPCSGRLEANISRIAANMSEASQPGACASWLVWNACY